MRNPKVPARLMKDEKAKQRWSEEVERVHNHVAEVEEAIADLNETLHSGAIKDDHALRQDYNRRVSEYQRELDRTKAIERYVESGVPLRVLVHAREERDLVPLVAQYEREEQKRIRELPVEERPETENQRQHREDSEALAKAEKRAQDAWPELLRQHRGNYEQARVAWMRMNRVTPDDVAGDGEETQEVKDEHA